ncbi:sugar O-acetyltransferase [Ruminococcus sp.]|uniref:sugar O-acetyltransferase n=1 Tax=Ruminococcus sp. TaxID=41978 RepID=UPI004029DC05
MTEKEKMIAGKVYNCLDEELSTALRKAKRLCHKYNDIFFEDETAAKKIIDELLQAEHNDGYCVFTPSFWCDYGFNIKVGKNFYSNHNLVILDCAEVRFGDNVFIGPNCGFYTAIHPIDAEQRKMEIEWAKPIKVGNDVWFGGSVTVLPGVTIGDNVVIGAGSVVVKDIPSGVVAVGNPCKPIRKITEADKLDLDDPNI